MALLGAASLDAQSPRQAMQQDPACRSLTPVAAGGMLPKDADTVVIRWLGHTNYELVYRGNVFLLDTYYERVPRSHSIGLAPADLKKATAIFIGHPHFDHISDAPVVAKQTGAQVVAAPSAADLLVKAGVSAKQFRAVKGGDVLQYPGATVETVLGRHNVIATTLPEGFLEKQNAALQEAGLQKPYTPEEQKQVDAVRARGSRDPDIGTTGVINYLFTLGNNFRVMFADSPGPVTDGQRALMSKVSSVDVAMLPYFAFEAGIPPLVELVKTFQPSTVFLGHHDGPGTMLWASNYPPAYAIRAASPQTRTLDVLYRTPVCFNTATKDVVIGW
jgi:L-ascorbate metabolism protein UlaG (beta-lactamase superfamily)